MLVPVYLGRLVLPKKYIQTCQGSKIQHQIFWGVIVTIIKLFGPFDHPRPLKTRGTFPGADLKNDGVGAIERSQGKLAAFFPLARLPSPPFSRQSSVYLSYGFGSYSSR